ncbi:MAG: alpha/beta hydrolase [Pseudomonadota bacterium]
MSVYQIDADNALYYDYCAPSASDAITFVFFNPLTGDTGLWESTVRQPMLDAGHGALVYNMRGQANSPFSDSLALNEALIVEDARQLLTEIEPPNPVFVGLSIGGLYAAQLALQSVPCAGLVLLNTLRRDGPRLQWISDVLVKLAETGGPELLKDILSPLIMNESWQQANRAQFLTDTPYQPIDRNSGTYNLLNNARQTNWDLPYEQLTMPVMVMTGIQDRVFRDPQDIDTLYQRLPNARHIELPAAGHMIPAEQPQELISALQQMALWVQDR